MVHKTLQSTCVTGGPNYWLYKRGSAPTNPDATSAAANARVGSAANTTVRLVARTAATCTPMLATNNAHPGTGCIILSGPGVHKSAIGIYRYGVFSIRSY